MYEFSEKDGKTSELKRAKTLKKVKAREKEQSFGFGSVFCKRPVNKFSVILGRSHRFLGMRTSTLGTLKCLAQGQYTVVVGFEPWTSRSGVRSSTTEPPRLPKENSNENIYKYKEKYLFV